MPTRQSPPTGRRSTGAFTPTGPSSRISSRRSRWTGRATGTRSGTRTQTPRFLLRAAVARGEADHHPFELQAPPSRGKDHRRPAPDGAEKDAGRLGDGGKPRLRLAPQGRFRSALLGAG